MSFALTDTCMMTQSAGSSVASGGSHSDGSSGFAHRRLAAGDKAAILVVDDDREDRQLIERALRRAEGCDVAIAHAADFSAALQMLRTDRFRVALIDLQLGVESGLELVRQAGGRTCATPLILLTGAGTRANDVAAMAAGVIDYIDKQELTPTVLERTIRYACHTHALECTLHDTMQRLERASRAKSDFLARMSHDFRTPLNAILGFSELIRDEIMGPVGNRAYADYAGDIHASGSHLLDLVNDVLDLAKIEAGQFKLELAPIDVHAAVVDAVRVAAPQAARRDIRINAGPMAGLPRLRADARALKQMLLNLLSNAVKFTDAGGTISIEASKDNREYRLAVIDTGIGIEAGDIDRVLAPFGQVRPTIGREEAGTGLGLPIVKSLIEAHGGRLEIDSAPGKGTVVALCFPV